MQDELEKEKSSSGGWFGTSTKQELNKKRAELEHFQEELDTKIKENEELHIRLYESKQEQKTIMEDVMERISKLKETIDDRDQTISTITKEAESKLNSLVEDNQLLSSKKDEVSLSLTLIIYTHAVFSWRKYWMRQSKP